MMRMPAPVMCSEKWSCKMFHVLLKGDDISESHIATDSQSVLASSPRVCMTRFCSISDSCDFLLYVASSLTGGRVYNVTGHSFCHIYFYMVLIFFHFPLIYTRSVCKVRGIILLLRIGNLWRCGDRLSSKYFPWQAMHFLQRSTHFSKIWCRPLITSKFFALSSLLMVGKTQKSHGARYELNSVFGLEKVDWWNTIITSATPSSSRPMRFLGFSNHEKGAPRQEISKWWTVCSTFSRSGRSVVRSASLAKGGTSKKRRSPHLHEVPTQSNKMNPRTLQTTLARVRVCTHNIRCFYIHARPESPGSVQQ
jgi:hypothetical protein